MKINYVVRKVCIVFISISFFGNTYGGEIQDAAKNGDLAKVEAILKGHPELVNSHDLTNPPPLLMAIAHNHIQVAELLLTNNADVDAKGPYESVFNSPTSLHLAAYCGYKDGMELLLKYHADINATNDIGQTPLHMAVPNYTINRKDVVELLLTNKANVNKTDNEGQTPLHVAAKWGSDEVVKLLIAHDADVNAKDKDGQTPLHIAAQQGRDDVVKLLLTGGSDINAKDGKGETPLQLAESSDKKATVELLHQFNGQ